jgi:hypothetical protein
MKLRNATQFNQRPSSQEITLKVDLDVDILYWISEKYGITVWSSPTCLRIKSNWHFYKHGVEPSKFHINREFSSQLSNFKKPIKKRPAHGVIWYSVVK